MHLIGTLDPPFMTQYLKEASAEHRFGRRHAVRFVLGEPGIGGVPVGRRSRVVPFNATLSLSFSYSQQ
jgi:hypothetical protein